jgi:MFS family permease
MLAVLCCTEITSWGILYYAFPVLLPLISADTGWSGTVVSGAFSAGQVLAACSGFVVGRLVDRRGPRPVMATGSVLGVLGLLLVAWSRSLPLFFVGWLVVGLACAGTLYLPAFAAITRFFGSQRIRALTALTVVGGLASTVFAPLTGVLAGHLPWRDTVLVLAVVLAVLTIPLHVWGLPGVGRPVTHVSGSASASVTDASGSTSASVTGASGSATASVTGASGRAPASVTESSAGDTVVPAGGSALRPVLTSRAFLALAICLSAGGFAVVATVVQLVPALGELGIGAATASVLLGLVGVGQVLGRLAFAPFARRVGTVGQTLGVLAVGAVVPLLILLPGGIAVGVLLCLLLGLVRGSFTMVGATAVAERWGIRNYGAINGVLTTPVDLARAVAPWGGAALASGLGSSRLLFVAVAVVAGLAAAAALATRPRSAGVDAGVPALDT